MELPDFLRETQAEVRTQTSEGGPYAEIAFTDVVMQHMADVGMTFEPVVCHYRGQIGNAPLRLSGYAVSEDNDQIDLFVSLYEGVDEVVTVPDSDTKQAAEQCLRFLKLCIEGRMADKLEPSSDIHSLAMLLAEIYNGLDEIRVFILTDRVAKSKGFKPRDISGKTVKLEVMDIERLHRHWSEGKPRDELVVDFTQLCGAPLPCVFVPGNGSEYDYALTAVPGDALRFLYEKFGQRLLEANVRSFLSVKRAGVNAGIQSTLRTSPDRFIAYNNGIVIVADEARVADGGGGSAALSWLKGVQIVNGGQTTASLYFTKKKYPDTDLGPVRVAAKIIVLKAAEPADEETLIADISRFANSQNAVRQSDLSANKPFHVEIEKLSLSVFCPDGVGRWFYERAAGSYSTLLAREGTTPAQLRKLKETIPTSRKITKTDLAKYMNTWQLMPEVVSLGAQKNFDRFMAGLSSPEDGGETAIPTVEDYKRMIAKAIIFRECQKAIRPRFQAFQANVTAYTVALIAMKLGPAINLDKVWNRQGVSAELLSQALVWAQEVNDKLHRSAGGRMISEWAKRPECREQVLGGDYSQAARNIPEVAQ